MKYPDYKFKKANYLYNIEDKFTAGIKLDGWEVQALNQYNGDINVSYCIFDGKNFVLRNSIIKPLKNTVFFKNENIVTQLTTRDRVLLLNKSELKKIKKHLEIKGHTTIPTKLYRSNEGLWKVIVCIVSGKNKADKRNTLKEKSIKRDLARELKS